MSEKLCCSKCGKSMVDPKSGASWIPLNIFPALGDNPVFSGDFLDRQYGQYDRKKNYCVCAECLIGALGIAP